MIKIKINIKNIDCYYDISSVPKKNTFANNCLLKNFNNAKEIQKLLTPIISSDVFISYSHKDEKYAKFLASELEVEDLSVFIDSAFWQNIDDALRKYDDLNCKRKDGNYEYSERNKSTSTFHMILVDSIIETLNHAKVFIEIDSSNYSKDDLTISPWLFLENKIASTKKCTFVRDSNRVLFESVKFPINHDGFIEATSVDDVIEILEEAKIID